MRASKLLLNAYDPQLCTEPLYLVQMDHITKLPKKKRGNTAILSTIDTSTHFVMLFAVRSLDEEDVKYALSQMFRFIGPPAKFLADNISTLKRMATELSVD
jgi:hypothetical protein